MMRVRILIILGLNYYSPIRCVPATWDSPPRKGKLGYSAFETAFNRFVDSRKVQVMKLTKDEVKALEKRPEDGYKKKHALNKEAGEQPVLGQSKQLSLMPFQVTIWYLVFCEIANTYNGSGR